MIEKTTALDAASLKKLFQTGHSNFSPYIFLPLNMAEDKDKKSSYEKIAKQIAGYKKNGFGGIIPFVYKNYNVLPMTDGYFDLYRHIFKETEQNGLTLAYQDDTYVMREYLNHLEDSHKAVCRVLVRYEYTCVESSVRKVTLHSAGDIMSVVAVNEEQQIVDLRPFIKDGMLEWEVPLGNWVVEEYVCECDDGSQYIDLMDYDVCAEYLRNTFVRLLGVLGTGDSVSEKPSPISMFLYRNIVYAGQNRRMWHRNFNKEFEELYGFDPAPFYPILFRDFGGRAGRYKCMFMSCRAKMLTDGYLKAAADCCFARNIFCTGHPAEGKAAGCSWMFGDGQLFHKYASAPGVSLPFAYLYGINGIKVAAGAADAMGCDTVSADLYKYFQDLTKDIVYREAMNGFVRGVNMTFAHLGEDRVTTPIAENNADGVTPWGMSASGDDISAFTSFVTRTQTLLRGGEHVSEVAILYPIKTLHSMSYLYHSEVKEFEYSFTPENTDYMEIMNDFLSYVGVDPTFLHPDIMVEKAFSEDGVLYLDNGKNAMKFKLLILPSMSLISLRALRAVKKFFDDGGKVIATDSFPIGASECSEIFGDVNEALTKTSAEDKEVEEIINHIFGESVTDKKVYRSYYKNTNEKGGIAYFFPSDKASVDGTYISASILAQAVRNMNISPDVYIDKMPRREFPGIVNYHLPAFLKVGIDNRLKRGGSVNCLHKKKAGCDIYYITNTTGEKYSGKILFRGRLSPEQWNPYNGKTNKLSSETVRFRGEIYSLVDAEIEPSSSVFVVSNSQRTQKETVRDLTSDSHICEFFPKESF